MLCGKGAFSPLPLTCTCVCLTGYAVVGGHFSNPSNLGKACAESSAFLYHMPGILSHTLVKAMSLFIIHSSIQVLGRVLIQ